MIYENVAINGNLLYEYNYLNRGENVEALKELAPTLNLSMRDVESILKYIVSNTILPENHPLRRMMKFVSNMLCFRSIDENCYIGYKTQSKDYFDFIFEGNNLTEFEKLLHAAGVEEDLIALKDNDGK